MDEVQVTSKEQVCAVCAEPWALGHRCKPTPLPSERQCGKLCGFDVKTGQLVSVDPKCSVHGAGPEPQPASRWLVVAGGDGYETHIVEGVEAMERKFLELHFGPTRPAHDCTPAEIEEMKSLLDHLRNENHWTTNYHLGRVAYSIRHEDGSVDVLRLTDDGPAHEPRPAPVTPQQAKIIANFAHAMLHVLDDWAAEDAQTGECEVAIPADQWKELNRVIDLLGDDPHAVMHRAIGIELERDELLDIPDFLRNPANLAAERAMTAAAHGLRLMGAAQPPLAALPAESEPAERLALIAVGAAGKHAERVVELEAEVSTLREHLAEVNRLMSLNCREIERLRAAQPVVWRRCIDSPYELQARWIFSESAPNDPEPAKSGWEPLYTAPPAAAQPQCANCETWKGTLEATERDRKRLELRVDELEDSAPPPGVNDAQRLEHYWKYCNVLTHPSYYVGLQDWLKTIDGDIAERLSETKCEGQS